MVLLVEKYRPKTFEDVVALPSEIPSLVASDNLPHFLFVGGAGCFAKGTKVLTPFGKENIENVSFVFSLTSDRKIEIKPCLIVPTEEKEIQIEFEDGYTISTSEKHLFYRENQLLQPKDLNRGEYIDYYDNTKLCDLWKGNENFSISNNIKKDMFEKMRLFCPKPEDENFSIGKKQSCMDGANYFKEKCKKIIFGTKIIPFRDSKKIQGIKKRYNNPIKNFWNKTKGFQGTECNSDTKRKTQEKIISFFHGKGKSSIQTWAQLWSETNQENCFINRKTNERMELCQLWREPNENGFYCSSYRWKYQEQQAKQLNSFMSELPYQITLHKKIKSIRSTGRTKRMFDLIVPDTNNFFLENGILVHNTGKTTVARIIVKTLGSDCLMLNSSEERGIDTIRDKVKNFARTMSTNGKIKIVFLDEVDGMTSIAMESMRNLMEECHRNTRFILTANYENKIIEPLKSRCVKINFKKISDFDVASRLNTIIDAEGINSSITELDKVAKMAKGDMRTAINLLQRFTINGTLQIKEEKDEADEIIALLKEKKFMEARKFVIDKISNHEKLLQDIFSRIVDGQYTVPIKKTAICSISNALFKMNFVADKEIVVAATLLELMEAKI